MKQKSLAYAKYWRICLADADLGKGALYRSDLEKLMLRPANELQNGRIDAELTQELFKHASQDVDEVEITIRPYIYYSRLEHGKARSSGIPEVVTPIVSQALLDRKGRIYPNQNTVIPRDILEPLDRTKGVSVNSFGHHSNFLFPSSTGTTRSSLSTGRPRGRASRRSPSFFSICAWKRELPSG